MLPEEEEQEYHDKPSPVRVAANSRRLGNHTRAGCILSLELPPSSRRRRCQNLRPAYIDANIAPYLSGICSTSPWTRSASSLDFIGAFSTRPCCSPSRCCSGATGEYCEFCNHRAGVVGADPSGVAAKVTPRPFSLFPCRRMRRHGRGSCSSSRRSARPARGDAPPRPRRPSRRRPPRELKLGPGALRRLVNHGRLHPRGHPGRTHRVRHQTRASPPARSPLDPPLLLLLEVAASSAETPPASTRSSRRTAAVAFASSTDASTESSPRPVFGRVCARESRGRHGRASLAMSPEVAS